MIYERTTETNTEIDYAAIKAQKNSMLQRFLLEKNKAEQSGQVVTKPI